MGGGPLEDVAVGSKSVQLPRETLEFFDGDELRARVFIEKYALRSDDGELLELTPREMWRRVAREIASVERTPELQSLWERNFLWLLEDFRFIPGGRIMHGAGNPRKVTLLNCYVIPIKDDSLEAIFDAAKEAARTYSYGGGVGCDISILRPKGAPREQRSENLNWSGFIHGVVFTCDWHDRAGR